MGSEKEDRPSLEVRFGRPKTGKPAKPGRPAKPLTVPAAVHASVEAALPTPATRVQREKPMRDPKPRRQPYGVVTASVVTGLVVGVLLVGSAAGTLRGCAAVRGTTSCGGAGLPLLALLVAAAVVLGGLLLLNLSQTVSAMSISFLALAFVALVCCLFLLDALDGWAALVIVPVLSVVGYLGSHLVTTRYIEPADGR